MSSLPLIRLDPEVVDTEIDDGELALLHLGTKTYFTLNRTGGRIWHHLKKGLGTQEVSRRLQEEFEVDAANAERSVDSLVEELLRHHLCERV
jgi:hypothetical protein